MALNRLNAQIGSKKIWSCNDVVVVSKFTLFSEKEMLLGPL